MKRSLARIFFSLLFSNLLSFGLGYHLNCDQASAADVNMTMSVQQYLAFSITNGDTVSFGDLTPGTPIAAPSTGTILSVTTNAANGYSVAMNDSIALTNSCMLHTDASTRITDFPEIFYSPGLWTGTGLGVTLFAGSNKSTGIWGTGTTYNHSSNKYAGIPQNATTAYIVTGYHATADTSSWAFKVDVPNTQKTGNYSGAVTITVTAVLESGGGGDTSPV